MAAQYSISSVSTAGAKSLKVVDSVNSKIYAFPTGTGLIAESLGASTAYSFTLNHPMVKQLVMPIATINDFATVAPAGNNYATDFASFIALMP